MYKLPKTFLQFFFVFLALLAAGAVAAYTGPLSTPPNCTSGNPGCDAPINVSATAQTKSGSLTSGTSITAPQFCIGASCITSWVGSGQWTTNGSNIYYSAGSVGIGTAAPSGKLDSESNGGATWAGLFNYNGGAPLGANGIWTHGTSYALYADGPVYAASYYVGSKRQYPFGGTFGWSYYGTCTFANYYTGYCGCPNAYVASLDINYWGNPATGYGTYQYFCY